KLLALPCVKVDDIVSLFGKSLPRHRWRQGMLSLTGDILKKRAEQRQMLDNFGYIAGTKIIVRHELKMRVNFIGVIRRKIFCHGGLQALALDYCLFVIRLLVRQVACSLVK